MAISTRSIAPFGGDICRTVTDRVLMRLSTVLGGAHKELLAPAASFGHRDARRQAARTQVPWAIGQALGVLQAEAVSGHGNEPLNVVLFVGVESTLAFFEATHQYLKRHGKPLAFYG
jgi:hypothetical protein